MRRLALVAAFIFIFTAGFATLERTYSQKFYDVTGPAKWIWAQHRMSDNVPVAFFAARDFNLPEQRYYTHLKVIGDPEYTVYLNGRTIGGRVAETRELDLYDISGLVKTGRNRIVIAVRAPRGVGGLLASIDISPEIANWVVTDGSWSIYRVWTPELLLRDVGRSRQPPIVIGEPPIGRWNYLTTVRQKLEEPVTTVIQPQSSFEQVAFVPTVQTVSGVAVAGTERRRATAFDFGPTVGRVRLSVEPARAGSQLVNLRFANVREELERVEWGLRPLVLAPGEPVITTPESRGFRYVIVFARAGARAEVVR